jgi:alcohol dehydrogenase class IV
LLPQVLRYDIPVVTEKLPELAAALGCHAGGDRSGAAEMAQETIETLLDASGAPRSLRSLGVRREDLPELAHKATQDICLLTSPRKADKKDLLSILEKAF